MDSENIAREGSVGSHNHENTGVNDPAGEHSHALRISVGGHDHSVPDCFIVRKD